MTLESTSGPEPKQAPAENPAENGAAEAFADARVMHDAALARLDAGDIRDAAEKAWCATLRATDGLIVARTGEVPAKSSKTTRELRRLRGSDARIRALSGHYFEAQGALHGECFYLGLCEPVDETVLLISETSHYIDAAERLAAG